MPPLETVPCTLLFPAAAVPEQGWLSSPAYRTKINQQGSLAQTTNVEQCSYKYRIQTRRRLTANCSLWFDVKRCRSVDSLTYTYKTLTLALLRPRCWVFRGLITCDCTLGQNEQPSHCRAGPPFVRAVPLHCPATTGTVADVAVTACSSRQAPSSFVSSPLSCCYSMYMCTAAVARTGTGTACRLHPPPPGPATGTYSTPLSHHFCPASIAAARTAAARATACQPPSPPPARATGTSGQR